MKKDAVEIEHNKTDGEVQKCYINEIKLVLCRALDLFRRKNQLFDSFPKLPLAVTALCWELPSRLSHIDAEDLSNISALPMLTSNEG